MPNIGFHCSLGPNFKYLEETLEKTGIDTFQVFTKNQRQWKEKLFSPEEVTHFRNIINTHRVKHILAHCTYLINLGSCVPEIIKNSRIGLTGELLRCESLGIDYAILHPGACKGTTETQAVKAIAEHITDIISQSETQNVKVLLENTAGQGSNIGYKFEHLADIIEITGSDRVGVCLDTCHAFVAGFDVRDEKGLEALFESLDETVGLNNLKAFHINDSKGKLSSRLDRHEHIGKGNIGEFCFRYIVQRFPDLPKVIETNHDDHLHLEDLKLLRVFDQER